MCCWIGLLISDLAFIVDRGLKELLGEGYRVKGVGCKV